MKAKLTALMVLSFIIIQARNTIPITKPTIDNKSSISRTLEQDSTIKTNLIIGNFINPGLVYEYSISRASKIAINIGYGMSLSYPQLTAIQPNHPLFISPFFDLHYKLIYNINKRLLKGKPITFNSGNFVGIKLVGRSDPINGNLVRTDKVDFAIGPTWGIQRHIKKIHYLINVGPQFYMDTKGTYGFYPFMFEINIGYILNSTVN